MRRWFTIVVTALGAAAMIATAAGAATRTGANGGGPGHGGPGHGGGLRYFAIGCAFSHSNMDDAIVFPGQPGLSHDHTYFGNRSTNASSTPASLRAAGRTSCRLNADTAAYWVPTLFSSGNAVQPAGVTAYYVRRTTEPVQAFPAGLKMIAGSAAARAAQDQRITSWSCGVRRTVSSTIPNCAFSLRLQVNFPNCWDGTRLDSADHKSHMAYSTDGVCPATHPVETPALTLLIRYPAVASATAELASGTQFSGHGDFVNAWNQATLERLVARYLNRVGRRGR
jgi:Domain of unknown function (DUF1996)